MTASLGILLALAAQTQDPVIVERTLQVQLRPAGDPQIAIWLEDAQGTFVDTLLVTRLTGSYGLGNRPGRSDFGGGVLWPYGRREMVLPVWAHRRGAQYPRMVFQDCREDGLGWHESHSSEEPFYCRPMMSHEMDGAIDTVTCPTRRFSSDKGIPMADVNLANAECAALADRYDSPFSVYPPRNDLDSENPGRDWPGVTSLRTMNDLDSVSQATPPAGELFTRTFTLPAGLADGDYTVWVEVNQAFDANSSHDYDYFIDPMLTAYGIKVVGQPSVVWSVPVRIDGTHDQKRAESYVGYGSWDGSDGNVRAPDATITTDVEGSGAGRLLPVQGEGGTFQVQVESGTRSSTVAPCAAPPVPEISVTAFDDLGVDLLLELSETATAARYEIRYAYGAGAMRSTADFVAQAPGPQLTVEPGTRAFATRVDLPRENTTYTLGVRGYADCGASTEVVTVEATTEYGAPPPIDACFVATAAHGAQYSSEVSSLRRFRDEVLLPTDAGLTLVELYYYLSPPMADVIREHPTLRGAVRWALEPLVWLADATR